MKCLCCGSQMIDLGAYSQCKSCGYARSSTPANVGFYDKTNSEIGKRKQLSPIGIKLDELRYRLVKQFVNTGRLLDYGCNYGHFITLFGNNGIKAEGYDINPLNGFATVPRGTYDAITMWDVLEHIEDDPLETASKYLGPGGHFIFSTPCVDGMPEDITQSHHWKPGEHIHYFSTNGLIRYLERKDFKVHECNYMESNYRTGHPKNILSMVAEKR